VPFHAVARSLTVGENFDNPRCQTRPTRLVRQKDVEGNIFDDFKLVLEATLTLLAGYVTEGNRSVLLILPIALAVSFSLVTDIDSPGWGVIRVHPQNLESLASSLSSHRSVATK
jgi:hypothetical protein